jgi:peptidyl-prolyl cis-trans isomerase D
MYDFVERHKRLIQVLLAIMFLPFAFFGVDSYFRQSDGGQAVATVGDHNISQQEFSRALQERQRAIQRVAQGRVDAAMLDNPEVRYATLEGLIQRRVLLDRALRSGMTVSEQQLKTTIAELPIFQDENNKFSYPRYEQYLKSEGQTPVSFEARVRHDLILQQLTDGYADSTFVPRTVAERLAKLAEQQREVSLFTIAPEQFASQVKLDAEAAKKYYEANRSEFEIPEQIRVEYVTHSLDALMQQVQIDPAEIPKYYAANRAQFEKRESQARHILISVEPGAGADVKQKARAKADEIYRQLQKKPQDFPELAKQYSQDPGSAAKGGDLGFITRGAMKEVPEFEETLFKLKEGEVSAPVETKLGFHIIQATEVRGARGKSLEEMRPQIEADLRKQAAGRMFAETAEKFNNTVYEQSESLKPAAELVKAQPRQSGWITRGRADEPLLNHPRLLQAVFSEDVLKNRRNTEAIEVAPNTLVAARLIEHRPTTIQAFEQVQAAIEKKLVLREAARLAAQDGKAKLELLRQGTDPQWKWSAPQLVSRAEQKGLPETVVRQAFRADAAKLPAYAGAENSQGGYTLVRITRVLDAQDLPPEKRQTFAESLRRIQGQEELTAYVASVKQKVGVKINKEHLERKER